MKIYLAGVYSKSDIKHIEPFAHKRLMLSYIYIKTWFNKHKHMLEGFDMFLDSSAFSHYTGSKEIDIYEYIDFLNEFADYLTAYANFDNILSSEDTLKNQRIIESYGFKPLPVYHYGEPEEILRDYLSEYDYVCVGGTVPIRAKLEVARKTIDMLERYNTENKRIHMFGYTSQKGLVLLNDYIYSTDSTKWTIKAGFKEIFNKHGKVTRVPHLDRWTIAKNNIRSTKQFEDILNE